MGKLWFRMKKLKLLDRKWLTKPTSSPAKKQITNNFSSYHAIFPIIKHIKSTNLLFLKFMNYSG